MVGTGLWADEYFYIANFNVDNQEQQLYGLSNQYILLPIDFMKNFEIVSTIKSQYNTNWFLTSYTPDLFRIRLITPRSPIIGQVS